MPNKLRRCQGCNKTGKKKYCYIKALISDLTNIQVDTKRLVHANIQDLQTIANLNIDKLPTITQLNMFTTRKEQQVKDTINAIPNITQELWNKYQTLFGRKEINATLQKSKLRRPAAIWEISGIYKKSKPLTAPGQPTTKQS
ncbi:hypothetical protein C2G38_2226499 [Gigaspora rosea]|uniref:Uncharacterized protein n=1 Tax=Gigaspora rosea TaxID=44941 RepID=A0A397U740_9GLOM|nr:hypothetical protein C2G38_2226499 [Gigaspora rosea]